MKFINNARCCVKIISSLGHEKEYPLNAKSLKLKIVFRHKDGQKQPQMVTFQGVDVSGANRIVKFDGQKSISFRPVADGDTYITVVVTSEDQPGKNWRNFSYHPVTFDTIVTSKAVNILQVML